MSSAMRAQGQPRGLALGTLGMLLVLSLAHPALSQGPADLDHVPAVVGPDWFTCQPSVARRIPSNPVGGVRLGTLLLLLLPGSPRCASGLSQRSISTVTAARAH
jgi:hypothetical protein